MTALSFNPFNWFRSPSALELAKETITKVQKMSLEHAETGAYHQTMGKFYADQAARLQAYVDQHATNGPIPGLEVEEIPFPFLHPTAPVASPAPKPAKRSARLATVDGAPAPKK